MILLVVFAVLLAVYRPVGASSCSNTTITPSTNTTILTASCDTIDGTLTISPDFSGTLTLHDLTEITGDLTVNNVGALTQLNLPGLETLGGALRVTSNDALTNLTLHTLQTVGELDIKGNGELELVDLENMEEVKGTFTVNGGFSMSLPNLDQVNGDTTINGPHMSCGVFDRLAADGTFRGSYSCSSPDSGLSAGAKAGIAIGVILAVLILVVGIWLLLQFRRRHTTLVDEEQNEKTNIMQSTQERSGELGTVLKIPRKPFPPKRPSEPAILDGAMIYEAPTERLERPRPVYELDAGPQNWHQRPIHHE